MIARLAAAVTGRRGRWVVLAVWAALGVAGFFAHSEIGRVTAAGEASFLPANAESTRALEALEGTTSSGGGGGEEVPTVIVFERASGLTPADLAAIGAIGRGLGRLELTGATPIVDPFSGEGRKELGTVARIAHGVGPVSRNGRAALLVMALDAGDRGAVVGGVQRIRRYLAAHQRPGLSAYVTGPAGIVADLEKVAADAGKTLLVATLGLVLLLLLAVYRAPILALTPLLAVGAAYLAAIGIAFLLIEAGWMVVNTEGTMLLLVHRYREELGRGRAPAPALREALIESGPALAASAATVIAAMLVLLLADLQSTHWLGPILAIGVAVMLASAFTLLPALLSVLGDRVFWPARPRANPAGDARWQRIAALVRRRSGTIAVAIVAALLVLALGNLSQHGTLGFGEGETQPTNSSRGTEALERNFPAGLGSPLAAVVKPATALAVTERLERLHSVELAVPVPAPSGADEAVVVLVLRDDPYGSEASAAVEEIRDRLHAVDPGGLLAGLPVENYDVEQTNAADTRRIVPTVLVLVGLILCLLLRALVAPAYLILTVIASFTATLGVVTFAFAVLGGEGLAFNLVLMSFLFLVALGVDYNIFLMTRAREEAAARGTPDGVLAALVSTGGVVTGAGLILAGTFATLTLLPLEELVQIGATVAIGVLLDTFVVRALLIPAITYRLGDRAWWPGSRLLR